MVFDKQADAPVSFFPVPPIMLFPNALGTFSVHLWQGGDFVLYTKSGQRFTEAHRRRLHDNGVKEIFVKSNEKPLYEKYLEENLGSILQDETLPASQRSRIFYEASEAVVRDIFVQKLPATIPQASFERIRSIVSNSIEFLADNGSLAALAPFISHDYKTYTHCMHVFIFTVAILNTFSLGEQELFECGLGAMLHDVGKTRIPRSILNKRGSLTAEERQRIMSHPMHGISMCTQLPLSQNTINCILFHHEKMDGSGYPAGLSGPDIPLPVRVITISDIYDALTTARPYADAMPPYEALTLMRHEMREHLDMDVFKRLVAVLGGAEII
ncbi:HD-GYP domain-containing protein [Salidesulfovibrio brasiliensis]|uniref:HD-GYP domain-containing protein n=1 Tax=Salidesulfovibrio brasiliensis TaxID=221711 RepID=UPI0006D1B5BC|nr:HD domain-containing phosphohydrolase [Salidesulfovibrio brasiliensis]